MKSRIISGAVLLGAAISLAGVPAAQAAPGVCNQATPHWLGGGLDAVDPPTDSPAARYTMDLGALPYDEAATIALYDAAQASPSLTACNDGDAPIE